MGAKRSRRRKRGKNKHSLQFIQKSDPNAISETESDGKPAQDAASQNVNAPVEQHRGILSRLFDVIDGLAANQVVSNLLALVFGAIALSGKLDSTGTLILFALTWSIIVLSLRRRGTRALVGGGAVAAIVLGVLAFWFRPDPVPKFAGRLQPKGKLFFSADLPNHPRIEIGNSGAFIDERDEKGLILGLLRHDQLKVEIDNGKYRFSTKVTDEHDRVIAEISNNEWLVPPPPGTLDRNYDDNALEIKDDKGQIVLQVQAFPDRVQLQGLWWADKSSFLGRARITVHTERVADLSPLRVSNQALISFGPAQISPLFVYPSALHLGERAPVLPVGLIMPSKSR